MHRWRELFLGLAVAVCAVAVARAAELRASTPEVRKAVIAVIEAQLEAFRAGEPAKAWSYASRDLRASRPLRVFTIMVRENYAELWGNTRAEYGLVRDDGTQAALTVHVYAKEANAAYEFTLVKEPAGWRVNSVLRPTAKPTGKV